MGTDGCEMRARGSGTGGSEWETELPGPLLIAEAWWTGGKFCAAKIFFGHKLLVGNKSRYHTLIGKLDGNKIV